MAKTLFIDGDEELGIEGTRALAAFLNSIYQTGGGHVHDGGSEDGHASLIVEMVEKRDNDPDMGGWGLEEAPYFWFNTTDKKLKMWNGEEPVILG